MLTILITEDDRLVITVPERVMQRSKLVDNMHFLVAPNYNGLDMSLFTATLKYLLPTSKEYITKPLILSEELYKDHLEYKLSIDTDLTKEAGLVEMFVTFTFVDLAPDGSSIQRVRQTKECALPILPLAAWANIKPDNALDAVDQKMIQLDARMKAFEEMAQLYDDTKADSIAYDPDTNELHLKANNESISKVVLEDCECEDGVPVVNFNEGTDPENPGEVDNVIEF